MTNDLADASPAAGTWQELAAEGRDVFDRLTEAARRHGVMISVTITPYDDDEGV